MKMSAEAIFGQVVKAHRSEMGLTQEELARRVGCASVTVRKIEYGNLRPSVQIAERLAMSLNIPLEERAHFVHLARVEHTPFVKTTPSIEEIGIKNLSGCSIRGYMLGDHIGGGGFGAVYRGMQSEVKREVAVKVILPKHANHPEFIRSFEAVAQLVARLEHPHIVPLYDFWREPNAAYLVMRFLRGGNLQQLLQNGPLQPELTLRIMEHIGAALGAAHRAGIIHSDLKPANVLLDDDHNAYLADFSIANVLSNNSLSSKTHLDAIVETPNYISPEQIRSESISPQTDIYSLGMIMYELLTGTAPFQGSTPIETMHHHLSAPMPPLAANRGGLSKALDKVIECATAKDPCERYENVESLIADFRRSTGVERRVMATEINPHITSTSVALTAADNPYKGLRAFETLDAADFFGRETLTQQLLARLGESGDLTRFLAVSGPSGSGKSSVVKAGLIPALRRGELPGSENWFIVELTPSSNPLKEIEVALLRIAVNPTPSLIEHLREDKEGLLHAVNRCLPDDPTIELVMIIDQFEELFTLVQDEAIRTHLLDNLVTAVLDERSRLYIVITLRADFVDRPLNYLDFGELIHRRTEFVLPLTTDELERAILSPAERVGMQMEAGVVSAIVHDLGDQPGTLPLLQYALTELFEKREGNLVTSTAYQSIGGVLGALGKRAEEVFAGLDKASRDTSRQLFLRLVTLGESVEDTRRRVLRSEIESFTEQENKKSLRSSKGIELVLEAFTRSRLLTIDRDPLTRVPTVEIAHEALIRSWKRLRDWLTESREDLRILRQLTRAAKEWENARRDPSFLATGMRLARFETLASESDLAFNEEERSYLNASIAEGKRRESESRSQQKRVLNLQRWVIGILTVSLLLAMGLSIFAINRSGEAQTQAQIAFSHQLAAQALAEVQKPIGNDEFAALLAIRSLRIQYDPIADAALVEAAGKLPLKVFSGHSDELRSAAFSSDGKHVLTGSIDTTARLWDATTGKEIYTLRGHTDEVLSVAFSPDGKYMLTGSRDDAAKFWDITTGQEVRAWSSNSGEISSVVFSPDGKHVLTNGDGATLWEVATGQVVYAIDQGSFHLGAAFSPDGKYFLIGDDENTATLWETATGKIVHTLRGHSDEIYGMAFSPDGKYALTGGVDNTAILWDAASGQEVYTIRGHSSSVRNVAFSPDGKYILTGSADRTARLWDVTTGQELRSWRGHFGRIWSIAFSPDGKYILTGSADGTAKLWDFNVGEGRTLRGHSDQIYGVAFSPDGKYALTSSLDQTAKLWDIGTGKEIRTFSSHSGLVHSVIFSPDARYALTSGEDGAAKAWDIATGQEIRKYTGHNGPVYDAVFSPDGAYVLTGSADATARLWEASTGREVRSFSEHTKAVLSVAFSPDGVYAVTASEDATARVWDANSGQVVQIIQGPDIIFAVTFSPNGKYLLTGSADASAILWDVATGNEIRTFNGHTNTVYDVAFSPDGKYAVTASADRTAKLWDIATGEELRTLSGHDSAIWSVTFSPDSKYVLTGSFDGTAKLWEVDYRNFVADVCTRLLRDFTDEERAAAHITDQGPSCPLSQK